MATNTVTKKSSAKPLGQNAQNGTSNDAALVGKDLSPIEKTVFDYTDYFETDQNPLGGFKGVTTSKRGY